MAFPVRGLSQDVIDRLDAAAAAKGVSRNAYVVEVLTQHARQVRPTVTRESFARAAELASDLGDKELMRAAWS
ncbi:MAG: type II toxin-antitoxin system VapB family antitoxin [Egibacteraceae bacterium]